ncbi:MAG: hypothetical protein M3Q82_00200 [Actinomycetota bacterium]|nr:hypothetical protein [Actinomycetota bacterium]
MPIAARECSGWRLAVGLERGRACQRGTGSPAWKKSRDIALRTDVVSRGSASNAAEILPALFEQVAGELIGHATMQGGRLGGC